jgi:hypothetical protein
LTRGLPALTWGGIASAFDLYMLRKHIVNFSIHSAYFIGIDIDAEQSSLVAVLSTENMILNECRQPFWGYLIFIAADASYQLTQEKNGVYPVITTNLTMETKTIAIGLTSHKHHKAQRIMLGAIKSEMERIVRDKTHGREASL